MVDIADRRAVEPLFLREVAGVEFGKAPLPFIEKTGKDLIPDIRKMVHGRDALIDGEQAS